VSVPARCAHRVGDADPASAVLAEPLATCVHAFALAAPPVAGTAVVIGGGTIGVLAAQLLRRLGVAEIVLSDVDARRRESAGAVADRVVAPGELADAVAELTSGRGAGLTVDAVGVDAARRQSLETLEIGGTAVWLGMHAHEATVPAFDAVVREQRVQGSFAYTDPEFATAVRLLGPGGLEPAVSHDSFSLDESAVAFRSMVAGEAPAAMKAIVRPSYAG